MYEASDLSLINEIDNESKRIKSMEQTIGKGLYMPNNCNNSGPRKIMASIELEQSIGLLHPEVPLLGTGYEPQFGMNSSSFVQADGNYLVLAKIEKFSFAKNHIYYLLVQNQNTFEYDIFERKPYEYVTESYGYLYNNDKIDSFRPGNLIKDGDTIRKTNSFDKFNNRMDGKNIYSLYVSNEYTKEDAFECSEAMKEKMAAPLINKVSRIINDNDIPLNMYGNDTLYKPFPNINEKVLNGLLLELRRENNDEALFAQSKDRLQQIMISDEACSVKGIVVDIDVYCNNPELLDTNEYFKQIKFYNDEKIRFNSEIVNAISPIIKDKNNKCSYKLQKIYSQARDVLNGKEYLKTKPFSNILIEFTILDKNELNITDKLANRDGGKGVVSKFVPVDQMPKVKIGDKIVTVDLIFNTSTCINRENPGQLFGMSVNYIADNIIRFISMNVLEVDEALKIIYKFYNIVSPLQGKALKQFFDSVDDIELKKAYIDDIIESDSLNISEKPITEAMSIDKLAELYDEFPWIKQAKMMVPQKNSNGEIYYIESRRRVICARQYIYRLKQYGEEKFSAVSLPTTNIRNENSRSNSKKNHNTLHSKTPVKFLGEMESNDAIHLGIENTIIALMLHAASPHATELYEELLIGDPYNIDIKLDDKAKNRSVEILNAYLTTMGVELVFEKIPKQLQTVFLREAIRKIDIPKLETVIHKVNPKEKMPEKHFKRLLDDYKEYGFLKEAIVKLPIYKK